MWRHGLYRFGSGQEKMAGSCKCSNKPSGSTNCGECPDQLRTC
jgi:hypothetical protein